MLDIVAYIPSDLFRIFLFIHKMIHILKKLQCFSLLSKYAQNLLLMKLHNKRKESMFLPYTNI